MIRLDHFVLNIDNKPVELNHLKKQIANVGYPFEPTWGKGTKGFKAANIWIGEQYFELIWLLTKDGGGWKDDWVEKYNKGHRGIIALYLMTDELDNIRESLIDRGIQVSEPQRISFRWFFGLLEKKMPWRSLFTPPIPGTSLQICFAALDSPQLMERVRQYMVPNSSDHGIVGIKEAIIANNFSEEALNYLKKLFPDSKQQGSYLVYDMGFTRLFFESWRETTPLSIELRAATTNQTYANKDFQIENVKVTNIFYPTSAAQDLLFYRRMGKGYPLILIHGAMVSGAMFSLKSVAEELSKDFDVIIPDLRGHGKSKNMPGPYTTAQHAEDIKKLSDAINIKNAYILGISYGGVVAQQITHSYPSLVNKLILGGTFSYNKITLREKIEAIIALLAMRLLGATRLLHLGVNYNPELKNEPVLKKEMQKMFADNDPKAAEATMKEVFTFDSRSWVHHIHCPTLVIEGSASITVPVHHAYFLHDKIKGSQLEIFEDASHVLLWTHSERFVNVVKNFLGRYPDVP